MQKQQRRVKKVTAYEITEDEYRSPYTLMKDNNMKYTHWLKETSNGFSYN